ncbi:MAG: hypothetical protein MZW92_52970 [Comamonadaceae bacterium]|nr:hypothetical protein [Comamonadaceae bacterium]
MLLLALLGVLAVLAAGRAVAGARRRRAGARIAAGRIAAPMMILMAGLSPLGRGASARAAPSRPGAVLAAAAVLLNLSGVLRAWAESAAAGCGPGSSRVFSSSWRWPAGLLAGGRLLQYPPDAAGAAHPADRGRADGLARALHPRRPVPACCTE